jgi:DNA-binding transcriptional regulator YhcF (GntR family)
MDDDLIKSWEASNSTPEHIAADTAIGIKLGRIKAIPSVTDVAQEWSTSTRTVQEAWKILGDSNIFKKDETGRYYLP